MKLSELVRLSAVAPEEVLGDAEVVDMSMDSRSIPPGALFVCMPSANSNSHAYIGDAATKGAVAAVVFGADGLEHARQANIAAIRFTESGIAYNDKIWRLCRAFFQNPTHDMKVVGVTGTNGKTTTAWLIRDMLAALGLRAGYLGTLGLQLPGEDRELSNTTPFAVELYGLLNEARNRRTESLAIEVSSHALYERRADGIEFDAAVFTNLTQDHLDFHGSMESYAEAKHRLFTSLPSQSEKRFVGAFNVDDRVGARWALEQDGPSITYSRFDGADLVCTPIKVEVDRMRLWLEYRSGVEVDVPLGGNFNVSNCVSAAAGMLALGYDMPAIAESLPKVRPVPGRFEAVENDRGIGIVVDYAHTPDALEKLLDSVRELQPNRIITVFGCGGDRDRTKRPKMARSASDRSDVTVITSDNPRTEDPAEILSQVQDGLSTGAEFAAIIDRREAVAYAVSIAEPGDVVVIAGKGHENYQIIGRTKHPMDDRELAREALR